MVAPKKTTTSKKSTAKAKPAPVNKETPKPKSIANLNKITLQQVQEERARQSLSYFLGYESHGDWKSAPHLELLCSKLEAVERGEILRLMVFKPPRHGKSEVISKKFPARYLGRNPRNEIIMASYSADLAYDHSRIARDTLKEWGPKLWGVNVSKDSGAADRWGIAGTRGGLTAAGVGGPITGRGANIILLDDPVKNSEEAESTLMRERLWNWYRTTLRTRLAPGGAIVLVMTRWHEDDLAGRLLQEMKSGNGEQWEILNLPAQAEEGDILGREPGEWLWPERYPPEEYEQIKKAVGTRAWISLYQQRPSPDEGGLLKRHWWRYYSIMPGKFDEVIQSWDCAFKDKNTSDYVVGQVWGRINSDKYLLDQARGRMDLPKTIESLERLSRRWPQARVKLIEAKANGPAVIQMLRHKMTGLIEVEPKGGKIARANAVSPEIESGNIYLPESKIAPWIEEFVEECSVFPNGKHDDMVDSMTQALERLAYHTTAPKEPELPKGLPEDLLSDLMQDPAAKAHWLSMRAAQSSTENIG